MLQAIFGTYLYWKDSHCLSEIQIELGILFPAPLHKCGSPN